MGRTVATSIAASLETCLSLVRIIWYNRDPEYACSHKQHIAYEVSPTFGSGNHIDTLYLQEDPDLVKLIILLLSGKFIMAYLTSINSGVNASGGFVGSIYTAWILATYAVAGYPPVL